jgi:hypothetical protein
VSADSNGLTLLLVGLGAAVYATVFWIMSLRYPAIPLIAVFALAPFQNDLSGLGWLHFSLSELHLLLAAPLMLLRGWQGGLGWLSVPIWGTLILATVMTIPTWRESSGISLIQMSIYWVGAVALFSILPTNLNQLRVVWRGLVTVGVVLAVAALLTRSSYFLGLNKNGAGASLACALIVCVECWLSEPRARQWRWLPALGLIAGGLIMVLSRGAWLAALSGVAFLFAWKGMYRRLLMFGLVLIPVVGVVWASLPEESRQYASSFDSGRYNIRARELNSEWALEQWKSSPWIGVGVGLRKEFDATNVILLTLAESGPLGVLAVLGVHFWVLWGMWRRRSGLKDLSAPWASSHALAGAVVLSKFVHGLVDHYWSRGAIMIAWASVGFALSASRISGARRRHAVLSPRLPLKKMLRAHKGKAAYA